jgi:hypothetical protein
MSDPMVEKEIAICLSFGDAAHTPEVLEMQFSVPKGTVVISRDYSQTT